MTPQICPTCFRLDWDCQCKGAGMMTDEITVSDESFDYYTPGFSVRRGNTVLADCMDEQDAQDYATFLRFKDTMTPEMWDEVKSGHEARVMMRPKLDRAIFAALDTLHTALTKP